MSTNLPLKKTRQAALLCSVAALGCFLSRPAVCQESNEQSTKQDHDFPSNGFHLFQVDAATGWTSLSGVGNFAFDQSSGGFSGVSGWGSLLTGYSYRTYTSTFLVRYRPSYTNSFQYSKHWFNNDLSIEYTRRLKPRWSFRLSATASDDTIEETILNQNPLGQNFEQPAAGVLYQPQLLTPTPALLYGLRVFDAGILGTLIYNPSPRTRLTMSGGGFDIQSRSANTPQPTLLLDRTNMAEAAADLLYHLTPRTEIGAEGSFLQAYSVYGAYRQTTGGGTIGHELGPHWLVTGMLGMTVNSSVGAGRLVNQPTLTTEAGLTYRGRENTLSLSYRRLGGDTYGFGASATMLYTADWYWQHHDHSWKVVGRALRQQLTGGIGGGVGLWELSFGGTHQLGQGMSASFTGAYMREQLQTVPQLSQGSAVAVRLTMSWIPFLKETPRR